jgi:hypothetical protein
MGNVNNKYESGIIYDAVVTFNILSKYLCYNILENIN